MSNAPAPRISEVRQVRPTRIGRLVASLSSLWLRRRFLRGAERAALPLPPMTYITPHQGAVWKWLVPEGWELFFNVRWPSSALLQLRVISNDSYEAWLSKQRNSVDTWATVFGTGAIRGAFVPLTPGSWIVLLEIPSPAPVTPTAPPVMPVPVTAFINVRPATT